MEEYPCFTGSQIPAKNQSLLSIYEAYYTLLVPLANIFAQDITLHFHQNVKTFAAKHPAMCWSHFKAFPLKQRMHSWKNMVTPLLLAEMQWTTKNV